MPKPSHKPAEESALTLTRRLARLETSQADAADIYFAYRLLLNRKPDGPGWKTWLGAIGQGMSRERLVDGFMAAQEFRGRCEPPATLVHTHPGFDMFVDAGDLAVGRPIRDAREYEPHVTRAIKRELQASPMHDKVFLDIGANQGWYSLLAGTTLTRGRVLSIEPNPANVQLLLRSVLRNKLTNVTVYPFAISDAEGVLFLDSYRSNGAVTTGGAGERGGNYVRAVALDALLAGEPRLDVVKMDIEGHEPIALRGMRQTLTRHHPVLFFEFHPRLMQENFQQDGREYLRALMALGYRLAVIPEHGEELPLGEVEQVMEYWRQNNARLGLVDEAQLDLVARPV